MFFELCVNFSCHGSISGNSYPNHLDFKVIKQVRRTHSLKNGSKACSQTHLRCCKLGYWHTRKNLLFEPTAYNRPDG